MSRQPRLFEPEVPIPEELRPAVELWVAYKRERHEVYKPTGLRILVERMVEMGADRAMAAVRHSAANNWSGLFESKGERRAETGPAATPRGGRLLVCIACGKLAADSLPSPEAFDQPPELRVLLLQFGWHYHDDLHRLFCPTCTVARRWNTPENWTCYPEEAVQ